MTTSKDHGYGQLIKIIKEELGKREEYQQTLRRVNDEDRRTVYGLRFTSFPDQETRDNFISDLREKIERVNEYLEMVAGRNQERHKELVSLLIEQLEINRQLANNDPVGAGGFFHEVCARERLTEIRSRIKEIVDEQNVC